MRRPACYTGFAMLQRRLLSTVLVLSAVILSACASKQGEPDAPAEASPEAEAPAPEGAVDEQPAEVAERPKLTAEECSAKGGSVVGDIGDGAIHRPDYRCESGAEPIGSIQSAGDAPVAVEGSVCCPK